MKYDTRDSGLLYKIRRILPSSYINLLNSFLHKNEFETKINGETSSRFCTQSGVRHTNREYFCPLHFVLYTSDIPTTKETTIRSFADDSAILSLIKLLQSFRSIFNGTSILIMENQDLRIKMVTCYNHGETVAGQPISTLSKSATNSSQIRRPSHRF